jgi:ankyrin repeat protein
VVKALVEAGADVNVETPVLPASPDILTYQLGADPIRPLPLAIANNHAPVALYLLEKGANPNQSTGGMSALHHAVYGIGQNRASGLGGNDGSLLSGRVELVRALLKYGANPNALQTAPGIMGYGGAGRHGAFEAFGWGTNRVGATPFYLAADCSNSNPELMRILLAAGADPTLTTEDGTTPLMASAGIGWGYSPPDDAARQRMLAGVRFLIEEVGADVNAANAGGFTALHAAAYKGSEQIIAYLVEHGAKMDVRDYRGRTPYHLASWGR